ncbi:hypothetical protein BD770DRAFT_408865 [Pilaira anomala]|nr:hypothetical protein BD770DRAFT_408865 [Pilaira anomala]
MPLTNETINSPITWQSKLFDLYFWLSHQETSVKYALPLQYGFQIIIGCFMLFCLIFDLIILTTSKLTIANWYWRPGVFFFTFTCGNQIVSIMELLFGDETFLNTCQQQLGGSHGSITLVMEVCKMQIRLNHITSVFVLFRDLLICGAYVGISYFYILRLIQVLKNRASLDTPMHVMANSYNYPITQ